MAYYYTIRHVLKIFQTLTARGSPIFYSESAPEKSYFSNAAGWLASRSFGKPETVEEAAVSRNDQLF